MKKCENLLKLKWISVHEVEPKTKNQMRYFLYYVINIKLFESQLFDFKLNSNFQPKYVSPEEQALLSLPEHLSKSHSKKNEEMLSSQMLSGIPEVDLGIDEKIRNIEATEFAKKRLAEERNKKNKLIGKNRKQKHLTPSPFFIFYYISPLDLVNKMGLTGSFTKSRGGSTYVCRYSFFYLKKCIN